jgi:hypothetical protein
MTKSGTILATLVFVVSMVTTPVWAAGGKVRGDNAAGPAGSTGNGAVSTNRGDGICGTCLAAGTLSEAETDNILYMVQEEKLARDVYLSLYDYYVGNEPLLARIFENISASEQRHMDAIGRLIVKYELENPIIDDTVGVFPAPEGYFTGLYNDLLSAGIVGYCEALDVGIQIEELDIEDLEIALTEVEAQDVARVFGNLLNGSENHLNAFSSRSEANCQ